MEAEEPTMQTDEKTPFVSRQRNPTQTWKSLSELGQLAECGHSPPYNFLN